MAMIERRAPDAQVLSDPRAAAVLEAQRSCIMCLHRYAMNLAYGLLCTSSFRLPTRAIAWNGATYMRLGLREWWPARA